MLVFCGSNHGRVSISAIQRPMSRFQRMNRLKGKTKPGERRADSGSGADDRELRQMMDEMNQIAATVEKSIVSIEGKTEEISRICPERHDRDALGLS